MTRARSVLVLVTAFFATFLFAQQPPQPLPPEVGNAVLLATNSIQVDRDVVVTSGDLVVNHAAPGAVLGEKELSLDAGVRTPAGFALKANGVDVDGGAVVNSEVRYNVLQNAGTINGPLVTPLALPVIGTLPIPPNRPAGTEDVIVPDGEQRIIGRGDYGALAIGRGATLRLPGGPYTFTSITVDRGGRIIWDGPGDALVHGRMSLAAETEIGAGFNITTKRKMFFVLGQNGDDGLLTSTPPAVAIGRNATIGATIHAPNGTIDAGAELALTGSFVARDIHVGRDSTLVVRSGFRNLPPVAISQNVVVGSRPVTITLTGFDPDSDPLIFSIALQPQHGTLGAITQTGPTSATVVYTPRVEAPDDVFTFRVTDSEGFIAQGVVTINEGTLPEPPATVIAEDSIVEVPAGPPTTIAMLAVGPPGVPLTFSIVTQPEFGTLGAVQQPSQMPPLPARVLYRPNPDYIGEDHFVFQACGTINGEVVCDSGVVRIAVIGPEPPPELAPDLAATTPAATPVSITLGGPAQPAPGSSLLAAAAIAGSVSSNGTDSSSPLMSAGFGPSGTTRMHIEWDISGFAGLVGQLQSATVLLRTNRGANDTLTTAFHALGDDGDGQLTAGDYARPAEQIPGAMMSVPQGQPVGADGTFTFDVLAELRAALQNGFTHFSIQGRVSEPEEAPEGAENGLHVYTTAPENPPPARPQLGLAIGGQDTRTFRILTLPANGTLRDSNGTLITAVPYTLPSAVVTYRPNTGFSGTNAFTYEVTAGEQSDTGTVTVTVLPGGGDGR